MLVIVKDACAYNEKLQILVAMATTPAIFSPVSVPKHHPDSAVAHLNLINVLDM